METQTGIIIKTEEQIEGIRKSCKLAAVALLEAEHLVEPGVTTEFIDSRIEEYIRDHGAVPAPLGYNSYPKATCISINEVVCHGIPDKTELKEGDIVSIDVSTILDNYYGDTCKTIEVGEISDKARNLMGTCLLSMYAGIAQVKPGAKFRKIGEAVNLYATTKGYSVVEVFCGHGVGLGFHEPPQIHFVPDEDYGHELMKPGMIFTIEPMINEGLKYTIIDENDKWTARTQDGKLSAQYEHTVLVTDDGYEILTTSSGAKL